jgi:hypothetical protein
VELPHSSFELSRHNNEDFFAGAPHDGDKLATYCSDRTIWVHSTACGE